MILVLNGLFPETVERIRVGFDGLLPQENIRVWHAPGPVSGLRPKNNWRRQIAELIREAFIADFKPDIVLVSNLFEGLNDDGVTSIGALDIDAPTAVALHDVIPFVHSDIDLKNSAVETWYKNKLGHLHRSDIIFAISESVRKDGIRYLGLPEDSVINISASEISHAQSMDRSAVRLISVLEKIHAGRCRSMDRKSLSARRPKLAYISPLPPERSGISDYSAELLPELSRYYDIDVIVDQDSVSDSLSNADWSVFDVEWFRCHYSRYDRALYHFGNSHFHQHMFSLLEEIPGVVVLHDFFLSGLVWHMDAHGSDPNYFVKRLYESHGYGAAREKFSDPASNDLVCRKYPCNLSVLKQAKGIVAHHEYSLNLAKDRHAKVDEDNWAVIPHLRIPAFGHDRAKARQALNLGDDDFIVCSFGLLGPSKLNHRLLKAWLTSHLAKDANCVLIFVGQNHEGEYGRELMTAIQRGKIGGRVRITGWVDTETFRHYLAAADIGVQLRTFSRGETSGAVMDCMNHSLATVVNANGAMADLPDDAVWKLPDKFSDMQLIEALETLRHDGSRRNKLGICARQVILKDHSPQGCAAQYFGAIERFYSHPRADIESLIKAVAAFDHYKPHYLEYLMLAESISFNFSERSLDRRIFLDISRTFHNDLKTGIECATCGLLIELIKAPPKGYRVEPVYLSAAGGRRHYRYARSYTFTLLGCPADIASDEPIDAQPGDIVIALDLFSQGTEDTRFYFDQLRQGGVKIYCLVFDLLPVLSPHLFPEGADKAHSNWLETIIRCDGGICISKTVAGELMEWVEKNGEEYSAAFNVSWFHLGADIRDSSFSCGMPDFAPAVLNTIQKCAAFLMVGTIEPRKGHMQTLDAFDKLWGEGLKVNLVIVGKEGWKGLPDGMRRSIPAIVNRLRNHPKLGKRLFWLNGISDEYLEEIYTVSTCLIAASEGEGFGLPLIEAARHKLHIIARDIPVFREVAHHHAYYFSGTKPIQLAETIKRWLELKRQNLAPSSEGMRWLTWKQSAEYLLSRILPQSQSKPSRRRIDEIN
ncbi:conserved hypothetical protein [Candidatus Desulfarcum epimagneticum]|uniref:Glycosyl transferase family 1 domain-containing protein n=1 Tax=uncultured Desulfobacteraceae bacterium TaxID=218296 RepID=A0A484HK22_9BACT|nr:conserved hypothetical protein [uncultured Desulfobacteraceae bacterium]